jgi:hypothetical protein
MSRRRSGEAAVFTAATALALVHVLAFAYGAWRWSTACCM